MKWLFSASIVALIQSSGNSIKTIDDLLSSPLTLGIEDSISSERNVPDELKNQYVNISDVYGGVEKVRTELFAFLTNAPLAYDAIHNTFKQSEKCKLSDIHILNDIMNTIIIEKNSPYRELLKQM